MLANQIHEGRDIFLGQLLLVSLYKSLGEAAYKLKDTDNHLLLVLSGPFWLLQLWLNATSEQTLSVKLPHNNDHAIRDRHVEGVRLMKMVFLEPLAYSIYGKQMALLMLSNCRNFTPDMAPFISREYGLDWFKRNFPDPNPATTADISHLGRLSHSKIYFHKVRVIERQDKTIWIST